MRKRWENLVDLPTLADVRRGAGKLTKRELAEMLVWRDPDSLYLREFRRLTKQEAVDDAVKEVEYIWSLIEQGHDW